MRRAALWLGCLAMLSGQEQPPRIRRGPPPKPAATKPAGPASSEPIREIVTDADGNVISEKGASSASANMPDATPAEIDAIEAARRRSIAFDGEIPNYICDQLTYRWEGEGRPKPDWKMKDRVTAELMFVDGKESLSKVKTGGKLFGIGSGKPPEKSGQWSSGDWVSVVRDALSRASNGTFTFDRNDRIGARPAKRYKYRIQQASSHWRVSYQGMSIRPAYKGAIWLDAETHQALRLEMEAFDIPAEFAMDVLEMTTELGMVRIAGVEYLLPVKSQNLSCQRGTVFCSRNDLEFHNYRKFTAESSISTTDSTVTFDGADDRAAKPAPKRKK